MDLAQIAESAKKKAVEANLGEKGYLQVGEPCFYPSSEFDTVDAYNPDGHEIRVYYQGQTPRCEITHPTTGMSLWVDGGIPEAHRVRWLMRKHENILIHTALGPGDHVLDLESGEVVPENKPSR